MKKLLLVIVMQVVCFAAFCQNPRWTEFGTRIPACTNLDVRWNTPTNFGVGSNLPTNAWPSTLGIYRLTPFHFSPATISNLLNICSLQPSDQFENGDDEIAFKNGQRFLTISLSAGTVDYVAPEPHYGPSNLAKDVPQMREMPGLITNFLQAVGINPSEIEKDANGNPNFKLWEPNTEFYVGDSIITNIAFRAAVLNRSVERANVVGNAGRCRLEIGEHKKVCKIELSWPQLERVKTEQTLKPEEIVQMFRRGKALQGFLPTNFGEFDWTRVKSVTINQAWPAYFAGSTNTLYPFLSLWATVETDHGSVNIEIDTPIIDEAGI